MGWSGGFFPYSIISSNYELTLVTPIEIWEIGLDWMVEGQVGKRAEGLTAHLFCISPCDSGILLTTARCQAWQLWEKLVSVNEKNIWAEMQSEKRWWFTAFLAICAFPITHHFPQPLSGSQQTHFLWLFCNGVFQNLITNSVVCWATPSPNMP